MLPEPGIKLIEHNPRLNDAGAVLRIAGNDIAKIFGKVDDERLANRLSAL
jgi:hypothetical protein